MSVQRNTTKKVKELKGNNSKTCTGI